jgi:hypothetical protein
MHRQSRNNRRRLPDSLDRSATGQERRASSGTGSPSSDIRRLAAQHPVENAVGDWLYGFPWDVFGTMTFATAIHPEQADKRYRRWIEAMRRHPARRVVPGPIIWVRGTELQRRGVLHFHVLIAGVAPIPAFAACRLWEHVGGGLARIYPYTSTLAGTFYLAKSTELDFSTDWFDA